MDTDTPLIPTQEHPRGYQLLVFQKSFSFFYPKHSISFNSNFDCAKKHAHNSDIASSYTCLQLAIL